MVIMCDTDLTINNDQVLAHFGEIFATPPPPPPPGPLHESWQPSRRLSAISSLPSPALRMVMAPAPVRATICRVL